MFVLPDKQLPSPIWGCVFLFNQPIYGTIGDSVLEASQTKSYIVFVAVAVVVGFSEISNGNPTDDSR